MTSVINTFQDASTRLKNWCTDYAFPLWTKAARDPTGGYFEALDHNGAPLRERERRMRVQPRQAYVFAHAAAMGWIELTRANNLSLHGFQYMLDRAGSPEITDGFAHRLNADHHITSTLRDTYDHAFVLLACAWRARVFGDNNALAIADATLEFLDRETGQPDGSFQEGKPAHLPRRQNPHMHLFEAMMALAITTGDANHKARANALFDLFNHRFFDSNENIIREFFAEDWSLDPKRGNIIEPGHMAEWCWLLFEYESNFGVPTKEIATRLYKKAIILGRVSGREVLIDSTELNAPSHPTHTRRTWVQTEYLKGTLAMIKWGYTDLLPRATAIIDEIMSTYLQTPVIGGYFDQYDAHDKVISTDMPTSTLYHLVSAAAEAERTAAWLKDQAKMPD